MTSLERARAIVETYEAELQSELPADAYLFDAHTHLGDDIDGMRGRYEELSTLLDRFGFSGAFVFCLDEPDREPGFCVPNDRTLAHGERSQGRLIPFVRLDLTASPIEEARRALDLGARGIKLHPRAQAFALDDERLGPVFELAVERGVPILIHGGRGLPPIAENLEALVRRNDGVRLIVAHAGIADMAALAGRLGGIPGVYFDTSVWSALDLLDLFRQVPPEQIVYASDYPYGRQPNSLLVSIRSARLAGFDDVRLRAMLGGTARGIVEGEPPPTPTDPLGGAVARPAADLRSHPPVHLHGGADAVAAPARRRSAPSGSPRTPRASATGIRPSPSRSRSSSRLPASSGGKRPSSPRTTTGSSRCALRSSSSTSPT